MGTNISDKLETAMNAENMRGISGLRIVGFGLYNMWLLAAFYNDFLFLNATDLRESMYLSLLISLIALVLTLGLAPKLLPRPDKMVLSKRCTMVSGIAIVLSTVCLILCDSATGVGFGLMIVGGVGTGISSGILFLGWCRVFSDVGTRKAMFEIGLSWVFASLLALFLIATMGIVAAIATAVGSGVSAILLRQSAMHRPTRPKPSRDHKLHSRTKRMFARGLVACSIMGLVQGFTDVLAGFKFFVVPEAHPVFLMVGCAAVALVLCAITLISRHDFVSYAYRLVTLLMVLGCLLTSTSEVSPTVSGTIIFGAYQCYLVIICTVCIDISNYFNVRATKAFGLAVAVLYGGELVGDALGQFITVSIPVGSLSMTLVCIVLTMLVVFANLFLFTEKDLVETSLGEMIDEEPPAPSPMAPAATEAPAVQSGGSAQSYEERIALVTKYLSKKYQLTQRETDVLPLVIKGRTIARIQEELHISQGTVSTHTRHIYQKTLVVNRQELLDLIDAIPDSELA